MRPRFVRRFSAIAIFGVVMTSASVGACAQSIRSRGPETLRSAYDRGYLQGSHEGELDARRGAPQDFSRGSLSRNDRGAADRSRDRDALRAEFNRGYVDGYRSAYARVRTAGEQRSRRGAWDNQEPAYARGYSDGFRDGLDDKGDRRRYDPVGHAAYRDGDQGYYRQYGSRDAYRNNYRAGFRTGYEDGYRGNVSRTR